VELALIETRSESFNALKQKHLKDKMSPKIREEFISAKLISTEIIDGVYIFGVSRAFCVLNVVAP